LGQGSAEIRVHVLDNASGDLTGPLIQRLAENDPRVVYRCHATNIGGIANFEAGLNTVDTEFFSILSDDDYLLPGFYAKAIAALDAHPEAAFWAGTTLNVDENGVVFDARVAKWSRHGYFRAGETMLAMTGGMAPLWTGIVFRRTVLESIGLPDREALGPADLDFILRVAARSPFIVEAQAVAVFTLSVSSFGATQPLSSFWPGWLHVIAKARCNEDLPEGSRKALARALEADARKMLYRRGINAMVNGRHDFATEASSLLRAQPDGRSRGWMLFVAEWLAHHVPIIRRVMDHTYRFLERRLLASRKELQRRYGPQLIGVEDLPNDALARDP